MRFLIAVLCILAVTPFADARKLTNDERLEIIRGMTAEFATLKVLLPRSKKALSINKDGTYDKQQWDSIGKELGPAGRAGDLVQITKITIEDDKLVLEVNGGLKSGRRWYDRVEVGMGSRTNPVGQGGNAKLGTVVALVFPKGVPPLQSSEIKKILAPVMDFEKRSATEQFVTTLSPEIQKAVKDQRAVEGMDRDTVLLAMGRPRSKSRETRDSVDYEDWVYGNPPGKMTFITFQGTKVVRVKDTYAGLGGSVAEPLPPR